MKAYAVRVYRTVSHQHTEWYWFFTIPYHFCVWYKPGGAYPKSLDSFLQEQTLKVQEFIRANPTYQTSGASRADLQGWPL